MPIPSALGRTVRMHRQAAGLSQRELAHRAGLSKAALVHLEHGFVQDPQASTVLRLARGLRTSADELLGRFVDDT
jgi:transcriptional regulator with XRE-family HTH domain